jgi:hypothetical protein
MVVFFLGAAVIGAVIGSCILGKDKTPEILVAIGSASVGAIAGLLAPPPNANRRQG